RTHSVRDGGVRRRGGIEDESTVVARAVPVDVRPDDGREGDPRGDAADRADVERPRDGERHSAHKCVTSVETAAAPLARVWVTTRFRSRKPYWLTPRA